MQKPPLPHLGLPEIAGREQLMWTLCQRLREERGIDSEDESAIALPVGDVMTRGKDLRGLKTYFICKSSVGIVMHRLSAEIPSSDPQEEKA
jgi:hypothetical protein